MNMSDNTKTVISLMGNVAIEENRANVQNWGVLFNTSQDGDEAFIVSDNVISRWSEFGDMTYEKGAPFFVIEEDMFMRNQTGIAPEELMKNMRSLDFTQMIRIPYGNLINFIIGLYPTKSARSRVRIIIKSNQGEVQEGMKLMRCEYDKKIERMTFSHPLIPDEFYLADKVSRLQDESVVPGRIYQCNVINQITESKCGSVNVKYPFYKGIEILAYESSAGGYLPDSELDVVNSTRYEEKCILKIPYFADGMYQFEPVHLDCNLLFNALSLYKGFSWLNIWVNKNCLAPVLIVGEKGDKTFPLIESALQTLNPKVRGDVR